LNFLLSHALAIFGEAVDDGVDVVPSVLHGG
jgi:hypothetical protein